MTQWLNPNAKALVRAANDSDPYGVARHEIWAREIDISNFLIGYSDHTFVWKYCIPTSLGVNQWANVVFTRDELLAALAAARPLAEERK